MKILFQSLSALTAITIVAVSARADEQYTLFRVCQDQHVIKTSDGADCGHIEYVVIDPAQQRIVSTVCTGGDIGERHIFVPFANFQMNGEHDVILNNITRERILAAPAADVESFRSTTFIQPTVIEKSSSYFGASRDGRVNGRAEISPGAAPLNEPNGRTAADPKVSPGAAAVNEPNGRTVAEPNERDPRNLPPSNANGRNAENAPPAQDRHDPNAGKERGTATTPQNERPETNERGTRPPSGTVENEKENPKSRQGTTETRTPNSTNTESERNAKDAPAPRAPQEETPKSRAGNGASVKGSASPESRAESTSSEPKKPSASSEKEPGARSREGSGTSEAARGEPKEKSEKNPPNSKPERKESKPDESR